MARITFFVFLLLTLGGCGIWEDFTTYFNLYYNTTDLFDKVEEQIQLQKKDLFSTETTTLPGTANTELVKIIEKCSNILQFNSESSYADDAVMILGKSFYYQANYQKSLRQFQQLLAVDSVSDHALESQLWIGKCKMRLRNYEEGLADLEEAKNKAVEEGEDKIIEEAFIEEIVYKKTIEDFPGAIESANEFLQVSDNDEIKAELWYEVGNLNVLIEDKENAVTAYQNVFEYSPDYELEVETRLKLARALRDLDQNETALAMLEDMRSEDKFEERFSDIEFEIGKTKAALGDYDAAIDQLTYVDTTYKNTPVSGAAKFEKADVYESGLKLLDSAAVYYKKASTSTLPKEYQVPAREKNQLFTRYVTLRGDISKFNKQLYYIYYPEEFVKDSLAYVEDSLAIAKEISSIKEFQSIWAGLDSIINAGDGDTTGYFQDSLKVADTLIVHYDTTGTFSRDSIFARIKNPAPGDSLDSLLVAHFDSMWVNKTFDLAKREELERKKRENQMITNQLVTDLPDTLKFKNNPPRRSKIPKDSLVTLVVKNQLELGNLFLSEINFPDSAFWYYDHILTDFPNNTYQATTLYALGSYYLTIEEKQRADSLFNVIYENYKNESIVNAAADKLNKPFIDLNYDPAKNRYTEAEALMLAGNDSAAVAGFYNIYREYPASPYAAKGLYTCGWIMENDARIPDSAAVYYDTLVVKYPASEYIRLVAPKLTTYKQELRKQEILLQDSLKVLSATDSLVTDTLLAKEELPGLDTVQVAIGEEEQKLPVEEEKTIEETKINATREPVWNPRRRK